MKLPLPSTRLLKLMDHVITNRVKGISSKKDFFISIGFKDASNLSKIKSGAYRITSDQWMAICKVYNVDANFFFDKNHTEMFKHGKRKTAIIQLKEAVTRVDNEIENKSKVYRNV